MRTPNFTTNSSSLSISGKLRLRILSALMVFLGLGSVWGQVWTYDFGASAGTFSSSTASTSFLPSPTSGTSRVRVGANPGSFALVNPGISLGSNSELQMTSNTGSSSTTKFSIHDYTASKSGFVKFKIAFSDGTNGVYNFSLGNGATFSDNSAITNTQVFSGIQWSLLSSNAVTYKVLNNSTYGTTGISNSTSLFTQSTSNEYLVEIYYNNTLSSLNYDRLGTTYSIASAKWDLWINGTLIGNGLSKGAIGSDVNIDSYAFNHQVSASVPGTVYLDDIVYSNSLPQGPIITGEATAAVFTTSYGTPSTSQSFAVSGNNLTADLVATAQTGFEVATTEVGTYGSSVTFAQTYGSASGTVWVRLKADASASGSYNGITAVALTSSPATSVNITTSSSGNSVTKKELTISADNQTISFGTPVLTVTGAGSYTPTGFVNSETAASVIGGTASYTTTYTTTTAAGASAATITPVTTNLTASNYSFTAVNGNITVTAIVPTAPTISITPGNAQLSVAFTAPSSNGGASITNYAYSIDNGSSFTACSPLQTTSPILITGLTNGTTYSVQILAVNSAGSGAASNTISETPVAPAGPTITANIATLAAFTTIYGTASAAQSIAITGAALTNDITATAPTGFEVATSQAGTYGATATFTQTGGSASGTVWVRLAALAAVGGSYDSQTIQLTSTNATTVNIATTVSGNLVSAKGLTITGLSAANKNWDGTSTASVTGTPTYSGLVNSESFLVTGTVTWAFPNSNVGNNITLTRTGSYDAPSANYTVTQPILTASINAVVCTEPIITAITNGDAQLSVAFTAPSSSGGVTITNYEYSTDGGVNWSTPSPAVTSSPILISGLTNGTTYNIQLRAINSAGFGAASTTAQGTPAASQTTDYFRSKTSGNWNASSTWESSTDNINWIAATLSPTTSANSITILNTHNVTVSASVSIDQFVVNQGGLVIVNASQTLTILNGFGDDMTVNGTLRNAGTITTTGNLVITSTGTYEHNHTTTPGVIPTATWSSGSTCSIIGYTSGGSSGFTPGGINQAFNNFTWNCPNQTARSILAINTNTTFSVSGTFNLVSTNTQHVALASNSSEFNSSIANFNISGGTLFFIYGVSNDGTYRGTITSSGNYTQSGGTVYLANGSTAGRIVTTQFNLTGSNSSFTQSGGTFYMTNVPPATTAPLNVAITLSGLNASLNIQNNANFYFSGGSTSTGSLPVISLTGSASSLSQTGGQIDFNPNSSTGSGKMNLSGSFNRSGTSIMTCTSLNAQNGLINFNGTNQTLNDLAISGNLSYVDFTISSGSTVTLQNDFLLTTLTTADPSTLTINAGGTLNCGSYIVSNNSTGNAGVFVNNGTLGIGSANGISSGTSLSGNIQVTSSRTYASSANYVYYGSSTNMITGNGLPSSLSGSLTIDNVSGVSLSSNLSLSNSLVLTSGTLDIGANTLTINGSISGSGQIDASSGTVAFGNATDLSLPTGVFTGSIANLSKTAGAGTLTLNDALTTVGNLSTTASTGAVILASDKQLTLSGTLTNNGTLTLESGATLVQEANSTASTATNNGYVVKQVVTGAGGGSPSGRSWYLGAPVSGATSNVIAPSASGNLLYHWNASAATPSWAQVTAGSGSSLEVGKGYLIRMGATSTLNFSSNNLNNGAITIPCYRQASTTFQGYNLISNPYPSYLNWDAVHAANLSAFENTIWYRIGNGSGTMVFDTYVAGGVGTNNYGGAEVSSYIPPMQAFWVRLNSSVTPGSSPTNLSLTNGMRSHYAGGAGAGLKSNIQDLPAFVRLNLLQDNKKDQVIVYMRPEAHNQYDMYDAEKMFLTNYPQIYTKIGDKKLVINGMKNNKNQTVVPLYLEIPSTGVYVLNTEEFNIESGLILLEDKQEGVIQDLTINDNYVFYANSGVLTNRFFIRFQLPDPGISATGPSNNWVESQVYQEGGEILISTNGKGKVIVSQDFDESPQVQALVQITDASGKQVFNGAFEGAAAEFELQDVQNGIYFVRVELNGKVEVKKIIVQL